MKLEGGTTTAETAENALLEALAGAVNFSLPEKGARPQRNNQLLLKRCQPLKPAVSFLTLQRRHGRRRPMGCSA